MSLTTITPTAHHRRSQNVRKALAELRATIQTIRKLRSTGKILDIEEAEGLLITGWWEHKRLQAELRFLRKVKVVKNSHISPNAARRHQ